MQMGTKVEASDALLDGVVRLDPPKKQGALENKLCSATVIGPRVLLTAEHCVREFNETTKKWGVLKPRVTARVPDGSFQSHLFGQPNLWSAGECGIGGPALVSLDEKVSSAPKFTVKRPFNVGSVVLSRLPPRQPFAVRVVPGCGVETLGEPRADVAILRLPATSPAFPWPTRTGLDGGPTFNWMDNGTKVECVGYGQDELPKPGESGGSGFAKVAVVKMIGSVAWFTDADTKQPQVLPPGNVGLITHDFLNAETPGQLPDRGDSGGGCVVRPAGDMAARRLVGVATEGKGEGEGSHPRLRRTHRRHPPLARARRLHAARVVRPADGHRHHQGGCPGRRLGLG